MYEKQNFYSGQKLKASQLDAMEDGIIYAQELAENAQVKMNIEDGTVAGSIQQKGFTMSTGDSTLGAIASGEGAVAFGGQRFDKAGKPVEEEPQTEAKGIQSFAHGGGVIVDGSWSAGFGKDTKAYQRASFVAGGGTQAGLSYEEWLVKNNKTDNAEALIEYNKSYGFATALGEVTKALGRGSLAAGEGTIANADYGVAIGMYTLVNGNASFSGGTNTKVYGKYSFGYGNGAIVDGNNACAIGQVVKAGKDHQAVFGRYNNNKTNTLLEIGNGTDTNNLSNAIEVITDGRLKVYGAPTEDNDVVRKKELSSTEVRLNQSIQSVYSRWNGSGTQSLCMQSNIATGAYSTALGYECKANGSNSFTGGWLSETNASHTFAYGAGLEANQACQAVIGQYNKPTDSLFIVGGGSSTERRNLIEIRPNGDIALYYSGDGKMHSLQRILAKISGAFGSDTIIEPTEVAKP